MAPPTPEVHDFGVVLAHGQTLTHEFSIANPSDRPIRLVGHEVMVPCCSGLNSPPDVIPPHGGAVVSAYLKAGQVAESKRVLFSLTTDDPAAPTRLLILEARFVPEWEIREAATGPATLLIGQGATREYRLVARRRGDEGLTAPREVAGAGPLTIERTTDAEETTPEGITVHSRTVAVRLRPDAPLGIQRGAIAASWPDGSRRTHEVAWTVEPRIRVAPAMLLLKEETAPEVIRLDVRTHDRPFRVVGVAGALLEREPALPAEAATTHRLSLALDARRLARGDDPAIELMTDDPDQPRLSLGVMILPRTGGER